MAVPKKSLIDNNYQMAQDIVAMPRNSSVKYGRRPFRRDFTDEEQKKILRRVSQAGLKRAADEYGASINVVKEWLKGIDSAVEEPLEEQSKTKTANDFTENEKAEILARVKETSISQAARDFGTTRWIVSGLISKAAVNDKPAKETSVKKIFTPEEREAIVKRADEIGLHEAAAEHKVSWQTINAWKHSGTPVQENQPVAEVPVREEPENLELENQILKKKIELLTKEFNRLKKAITDLTELIE